MRLPLKIAVSQPHSALGRLVDNIERHAEAIRDIESRVVVFPEMSLTGYAMDVTPIEPDDQRLRPLVDATSASGSVALVGAPTRAGKNRREISMLRVDHSGISVAYSKMFLGGGEPGHYSAGRQPGVVEVDGWRLGLAICKDNGTPDHAAQTIAQGIDAYVAGVCETEADAAVQQSRAERVTADHGVWVVYASFAGATGGGFDETAGRSAVWRPNGQLCLQLGREPGQIASTLLFDA